MSMSSHEDNVTKANPTILYAQILRLNGLTLAALGQTQVQEDHKDLLKLFLC